MEKKEVIKKVYDLFDRIAKEIKEKGSYKVDERISIEHMINDFNNRKELVIINKQQKAKIKFGIELLIDNAKMSLYFIEGSVTESKRENVFYSVYCYDLGRVKPEQGFFQFGITKPCLESLNTGEYKLLDPLKITDSTTLPKVKKENYLNILNIKTRTDGKVEVLSYKNLNDDIKEILSSFWNWVYLRYKLKREIEKPIDNPDEPETPVTDPTEREDAEANRPSIQPLNQILYGPPGTGKTYHTIDKALEIITNNEWKNEFEKIMNDDKEFKKKVEKELANNKGSELEKERQKMKILYDYFANKGQIVFTTFHQSMSYEDFIEGIKPDLKKKANSDEDVIYEVKDGLFKELCTDASFAIAKKIKPSLDSGEKKNMSAEEKEKVYQYKKMEIFKLTDDDYKNNVNTEPHVLIIDEINRGNVSQIFGELITLIEDDKRLGRKEHLKIKLPYSKSEFGVPPNLYVVATMNTADRSVEALDTALRRRFSFEAKFADLTKLEENNFNGISLKPMLESMNDRLEVLLSKDHTIGHAWLMNVNSLEGLKNAFKNKILPLLQEFFYNDYAKIGFVLGEKFVDQDELKDPKLSFAKFKDPKEILADYTDKIIYSLIDVGGIDEEGFKSIYPDSKSAKKTNEEKVNESKVAVVKESATESQASDQTSQK